MPFNGNGLYLPPTPEYPAVSGAIIEADAWNAIVSDIAAAISNCVTRDGQSPATANLSMGGFGLTNVSTISLSGLITQGGVTGRVTPVGGIIMYDGLIANIPAGWALCDGTNGTPDLRDKFVVGAWVDDAGAAKTNITGAPTKTGGSKDAIVVAHSHGTGTLATVAAGSHTHTATDSGHVHDVRIPSNSTGNNGSGLYSTDNTNTNTIQSQVGVANITVTAAAAHSHPISGSVASTGASGTDANLVPYYALAFIKCLAA